MVGIKLHHETTLDQTLIHFSVDPLTSIRLTINQASVNTQLEVQVNQHM